MRAGLTTSVVLHAVALGLGLFTLSAPRAFEVTDVESLPVDIVPIESLTQIQQGDKKSPMKDKPAPKPTKKPDIVPDAQKVGDNTVDTDKKPTPEAKPKPVETADAPPPSPEPTPKPADQPKPEPVKQPEPKPEPKPEPVKEPTPPQPKEETKPDQVAEAIAAESPNAEAVQLPKSAPSPEAKPKPQQPETAKKPDRKEAEKPTKQASSAPKSDEKSFNADEITALLNKEKASGGGAKRSSEQASLGGDKSNNNGAKLSQSEMDALRGQIQRCWNIPAGAADAQNLRVSVKFKLDRNGAVEGDAQVISGGGASGVERAAAESARRAVLKCSPYNLPADKYDAWADVIVNFDPSEMF
jgi:outer membrane biosynthesis protein TonB